MSQPFLMICYLEKLLHLKYNTIKTTIEFNFYLYQASKQHRYTKKHGNEEKLSTCLLLLVNLLLEKTEKSRLYRIAIFA